MGIVHRDLKSLNVLLDEHWRAKICDFGLSIEDPNLKINVRSRVCGTLPWMAPELLKGSNPTAACDVYSFGIVLWELLTMSSPYSHLNDSEILHGVQDGLRPEIPESVLPFYRDILTRCWASDPLLRPSMSSIRASLLAEVPRNEVGIIDEDVFDFNQILRNGGETEDLYDVDIDLNLLTSEIINSRRTKSV